ncbi:hypothetical protein NLJ89_g4011 [Agrocybe chaxingu]|uniref:Uncharacterized protein n=1 Tax=Agrocybe chaxingu TaxID=84603 RepID=A0A9W8MWX2_9AGAR|nr:hypothetical protein NLJ89_g4011 [Agrocybe chaxingu]
MVFIDLSAAKARVKLARAIYSPAEIILLDYPPSRSSWIVERCFKADLIKGRTVLLVVSFRFLDNIVNRRQAHNISLASPIADFMVSVGTDGNVRSQGPGVSLALKNDPILASEGGQASTAERMKQEENKSETQESAPVSPKGKLFIKEEFIRTHTTRSMKSPFPSPSSGY